jgi:hypothetical protein
MEITKQMIKDKLKQVDEFEAKWGECTESRAMRKYCTDPKYRERVHAFNKASTETIKHYMKYGY